MFNFSAGPAMLPKEVLHQAREELCNWNRIGASIMEISHRSKYFMKVAKTAEKDLRDLLNIPNTYQVLFCHGGARAQFSAVPMNLLEEQNDAADYIDCGYWSRSAIQEAKKYCNPRVINIHQTTAEGLRRLQPMREWSLSTDSTYVHYCPNETIDGIAIYESPNFEDRIVVADFSSTILSRPIDIRKFGLIYASAQKNIGPSGITLVIVHENLLGRARIALPSILNYSILSENNSMFNTPPTFAWYLSGLVFQWLKNQGGLIAIHKRNLTKANLLYETIDNGDFYKNYIFKENRSLMNIPFYLADRKLECLFLKEAKAAGLYALKGHKSVGGIRASLYNAMPIEGVQALVNFMQWFVRYHG